MPSPTTTAAALLPFKHTTITAYAVPSTTGLEVVDGTTLTWREQGITLHNGVVVSAGFNGLLDKTTTATFEPISYVTGSRPLQTGKTGTAPFLPITVFSPTIPPPIPGTHTHNRTTLTTSTSVSGKSLTTLTGTHATSSTSGSSGSSTTTGSASAKSGASSTPASNGAAPSIGAAKAVALVGVLGGIAAHAL